jgi:predicted  nucleic acid-binding Zn-ribbon protein
VNFPELFDNIRQDPVLMYSITAALITYAVVNYIVIIRKIRKRAAERAVTQKEERIARYKEEIASQAADFAAQQEELRSRLLDMDDEAFWRYLRQEGYDQQTHLSVSFGKSDDSKFLMFHAVHTERERQKLQKRLTTLNPDHITQVSDDELRNIEARHPHGNRYEIIDNPSEFDQLKRQIGERAFSELKRRNLV